ncbi:MAG TPA: CsbD family protein [Bryobacteraceae bacterium]|nr:CsbD family protein [Bryobacteraceae bacterium]
MNWDQVEGQWKQLKGSIREKFGKLTDDDLQTIGGKKDQFVGKLQERYGISREQAQKDLDNWLQSHPGMGTHETGTARTRTSGGSQH